MTDTKKRFVILAHLGSTDDAFVADVLSDPNRFSNYALGNPDRSNVDHTKYAYVAIPTKVWRKYQEFMDSKGIRQELWDFIGDH